MKWIISFLLGAVAGIVAHSYAVSGRVFSEADASEERERVRTRVVERRDTTVVRVPVVRERRVVDTLWVWADGAYGANRANGANRADSSAVLALPVEQRVYGDSTYTAWVSGVEPRLDSIQIYSRETIRETVREVERRGAALFGGRLFGGRLGVGVFGGVGVGGSGSAGPVVGVGLTYNFLCL